MTQEDKSLLLQDLSARLSYGVKVQVEYDAEEFGKTVEIDEITMIDKYGEEILLYHASEYFSIEELKPYLRPMSSMTEEEEKEYAEVVVKSQNCSYENNESATTMVNDWYLSKGFDVRGLIPKGLALEAKEGMYDIKNK